MGDGVHVFESPHAWSLLDFRVVVHTARSWRGCPGVEFSGGLAQGDQARVFYHEPLSLRSLILFVNQLHWRWWHTDRSLPYTHRFAYFTV